MALRRSDAACSRRSEETRRASASIPGRVPCPGQVALLGISFALVAPVGVDVPAQALQVTLVGALVALLTVDVALLTVDVALFTVDVAFIGVLVAPPGVLVTLVGIQVAKPIESPWAGLTVTPGVRWRFLFHDDACLLACRRNGN